MHLFLTDVLPFLAHDHASAAAFLTCRHNNFHASIIPEFLSDEERVKRFCEARQQNELEADHRRRYANLFDLFVQTPLMQFSPSLVLHHGCSSSSSILKPLLQTKYFTRTLQRCSVVFDIPLTNNLLHDLSKVQSLTKLNLGWTEVNNEHLEILVNSFPSIEILTIQNAERLKVFDPKTSIIVSSPPPPATKTLRSLTMYNVEPSFASEFVPNFPNLRKLALSAEHSYQELDLLPLSSSLPLLTDLSLRNFTLKNTESLKNFPHLSTLQFHRCPINNLSFLTQENGGLPDLTTLCISGARDLSTSSFASLSHAPNLRVLEFRFSKFNNDCFRYLENMVHLRKLSLRNTKITEDRESWKTLMQNLFQLEELNLGFNRIGNRGAIAGALYSTHSRLRVLSLNECELVDNDLKGIDALKNTLEVLDLSGNYKLTSEGLNHCKDLVKLKSLNLKCCDQFGDFSPLKDCLNLEEIDVWGCQKLTNDSFRVFSEEPNSFPNLRVLNLSSSRQLTEKVFEHLSKNNHLVYQFEELCVDGMSQILSSSATARNNICQLKGLRRLNGIFFGISELDKNKLKGELMQRLKNLEEAY